MSILSATSPCATSPYGSTFDDLAPLVNLSPCSHDGKDDDMVDSPLIMARRSENQGRAFSLKRPREESPDLDVSYIPERLAKRLNSIEQRTKMLVEEYFRCKKR